MAKAPRKVQVKFNRVSINVARIHESAKRNKYIVDRMEKAYKRDIAPHVEDLVNDSSDAVYRLLKKDFTYGINSWNSQEYRFSYQMGGFTNSGYLPTGWDALSKKTVEIKGHDRFWQHTGSLAREFSSVIGRRSDAKTTRVGVDKRRSRMNKKTGVSPLVLATTVSIPHTKNDIVDSMILKNFVGGYDTPSDSPTFSGRGLSFSDMYDLGGLQSFNGITTAGPTSGLQHMVLAESKRPYVQDLSYAIGSSLRAYLEHHKFGK